MRWRWSFVLLLAGCPSDPDATVWEYDGGRADGALDHGQADAHADAARDAELDAGTDMIVIMPMSDAQIDAAVQDGGTDAAPDMLAADAAQPLDAGPEMSVDAAADMAVLDMRIVDAALDGAVDLDMAAPDMPAPDLAVDAAAPDMASPDMAAPDMAADMAPDPLARPPVGFCAPVRPAGWGCFNDDRACEAGLTCINGLCAEPSPFEGPCDGNRDCLAGQQLYCARYSDDGAVLQQPFCRRRGVVGEACHRRNFGCDLGLVCVLDTCRERSEIGGPCLTSGDCVLEAWCNVNGLCAPYIPLGDPCNPQAPGCEPGFVCTDEVCAERAPPGDGCQHAGQCAVGQYCDRFEDTGDLRDMGVCTLRLREGDPCDDRETSVCNASVCLEGRCVADQPEEGACQSSFDCEAGFWCPRAF